MIKLSATNGQKQYDQDEWVVDTEADLENLPQRSGMGSTVVVIETGKVYMKNSAGEWVEL